MKPDWAKFAAQDADGTWMWYAKHPTRSILTGVWYPLNPTIHLKIPIRTINWIGTLESRPGDAL